MIDLNALDNDPWPTIPVKKEDLRALASALQSMEADLRRVTNDAQGFHLALNFLALQEEEPKAREMARRALGIHYDKFKGEWEK